MTKGARVLAYLSFSLAIATACYFRPIADDFDRYVYEALIRSRTQPIGEIYRIVKHESPRAEASTIMDSPEHLAQLEPLYAIRPIYVEMAYLITRAGLFPHDAINLVSAASLFLTALLVFVLTKEYVISALLLAAPIVVAAGRTGGPDALSSLMVLAACMAILGKRPSVGILLLLISTWVRTDNILIVLTSLGWLLWNRRLSLLYAGLLSALAIGSVECINVLSGNYGWVVLLHYSFIGGKYPAEITTGISLAQYTRTFLVNAVSVFPQLAPGLLLGFAAWRKSLERTILIPVLSACALHYVLFPSGEARYFAWAYLVAGTLFIRAFARPKNRDFGVPVSPDVGTTLSGRATHAA